MSLRGKLGAVEASVGTSAFQGKTWFLIFPMWKSLASLGAWCCCVCPFLGWALSDSQAPKALHIEWVAPNLLVFFHTHSPFSSLKATPSAPIPTSWGDTRTICLWGSQGSLGDLSVQKLQESGPKPCRRIGKWINKTAIWLGIQLTLGTEFKFQ